MAAEFHVVDFDFDCRVPARSLDAGQHQLFIQYLRCEGTFAFGASFCASAEMSIKA